MSRYLELREGGSGPLAPESPVFSFTAGRALHPGTISQTFHALLPRLGLREHQKPWGSSGCGSE